MLTDLTNAERFLLDRRRRGENQEEAGERLGTNRSWVYLVEQGVQSVDKIALGTLKLHEIAFILRRRAGKTQAQIAKKIKYSRESVKLMELGRIDGSPLFNCWGLI